MIVISFIQKFDTILQVSLSFLCKYVHTYVRRSYVFGCFKYPVEFYFIMLPVSPTQLSVIRVYNNQFIRGIVQRGLFICLC